MPPAEPPKPRSSTIARGLVALGIAVNVAFFLINIHPGSKRLVEPKPMKILLRTDESSLRWLEGHVLDDFEFEHNVALTATATATFSEALEVLRREKQTPGGLSLAVLDDVTTAKAIEEGLIRPFEGVVKRAELDAQLAEFIEGWQKRALGPEAKVWVFPKRGSIDVTVFMKPAVEEVYLNWEVEREAIDKAIAEANGEGLPKDFQLRRTPTRWTTYDLFVAAWYWKHHPAKWVSFRKDAPPAPRVAIRTGRNRDGIDDFLSLAYRLGMKDEELLSGDAPAVADALQWEALFRKHGLIAPQCLAPKGIDAAGVLELLKTREIAYAPIEQEDSWRLHGGSRRDGPEGVSRSSQLAWSPLPSGASLELKNGAPARRGRSLSFLRGHSFVIPVNAPEPALAARLARFYTDSRRMRKETEVLGLLPIRNDIRQEYPALFRLPWMQDLLDASFVQLERGSRDRPVATAHGPLGTKYAMLRSRVLDRPGGPPVKLEEVRAAIAEALRAE